MPGRSKYLPGHGVAGEHYLLRLRSLHTVRVAHILQAGEGFLRLVSCALHSEGSMKIRATLAGSRINGPGIRSVVWLQGCGIGCIGCQNPKTWDFNAGRDVEPDALAEEIVRDAAPGTVGLTLSGGEPLHQAVSVYSLMCSVLARRPDWDIGIFTGYTLSQVTYGGYDLREPLSLAGERGRAALWEHSILHSLTWGVFGPYDRNRPTSEMSRDIFWRNKVASANQFLTMFKRKYTFDDFPDIGMEVNIEADGLTKITGYRI